MVEEKCNTCILDTTIPGIEFDDNGECNFCALHEKFEEKFPLGDKGKAELNKVISSIKQRGKGKAYISYL